MSWERKLYEEEQKTQAVLEELSYSDGQLRADELIHGDGSLDVDWVRQQQRHPLSWLIGSPYHRGLGGHTVAYLWFAGIVLALTLLAYGVKLVERLVAGSPPAAAQQPAPPASPSGSPAGASGI